MIMKQKEKYPEGHFVNQWMAIGISLGLLFGMPLGLAVGNPGLFGIGIPIGLAIGLAIGQSLENKYKEQGLIRPLTKEEGKRKKTGVWIGIIALLIGIGILIAILLI